MIKQITFIFLIILGMPLLAQNTYYHIYDDANIESFAKVVETKGGYIMTGTSSQNSTSDITLYRVDSIGYVLNKSNYYPGVLNYGLDIVKCEDNGALVAGYSLNSSGYKKAYIIRVDSMGNPKWEKIYDYNYLEQIYKVVSINPSRYILMGYGVDSINPNSFPYYDFLRTIDDWGNILSEKRYLRSEWKVSGFSTLVKTIDGGLLIGAGSPGNSDSIYDDHIRLIKTTIQGDSIWTKQLPRPNMFMKFREASLSDMIALEDGSFIIQGGYLCKIDPQGEVVWQDTSIYKDKLSYLGNNEFVAYNHVIPPFTTKQVIKMNGNHTLLWQKDYPILSNGYTNYSPSQLIGTSDGGFIAVGKYDTNFSSLTSDLLLFHTDCELNIDNPINCYLTSIEPLLSENDIVLTNPIVNNNLMVKMNLNKDYQTATMIIYNSIGAKMLEDKLKTSYDLSSFSKGIYLYEIMDKGKAYKRGKLILI